MVPASSYQGLLLIRGTDDYDLLATYIQEKKPKEVKKYNIVFQKT